MFKKNFIDTVVASLSIKTTDFNCQFTSQARRKRNRHWIQTLDFKIL